MGAGIAQAASASGFSVIMRDISDDFLKRGFSAIEQSLTRLMKKEKITQEEMKTIMGRIAGTTSLEDMSKADFVVESAPEDMQLKLNIFRDLDKYCKESIILSTNTS